VILDNNAVSAIADGEYRYGIRQSRYRAKYERWLEVLMERVRILDVDARTTEH
jgi:predicted nucleic acid-binding protein